MGVGVTIRAARYGHIDGSGRGRLERLEDVLR